MGRPGSYASAAKGSLMTSISSANIEAWLRHCAEVFTEHRDELTEMDAKIGDADHGINMARGFSAVPANLDPLADKSIGSLFRTTAMTLISKVGGASGPLYGTFFLQAARPANGKTELTLEELCRCFDTGLTGIVNLGKAVLGDKTMVDALTPALAALHPKGGDSLNAAVQRAASVAHAAAEATIPLVARKGRASYLGERSAGHKDPGAASSALLLEALAETFKTSA
jgi:dihydroxyacetone kinase-like protein